MKSLGISICVVALLMSGCSRHSELHNSMEDMGSAFKVMRDANDIDVLKQKLAEFKTGLDVAIAQPVNPEDQATFDEGLKKVKDLVEKAQAAIDSGNLQAAKAVIDELGSTRKTYHEKLDVK